MAVPPALPQDHTVGRLTPKFVLLINPFYPKDPRASFGKHVLTPSLALTSIAGATPGDWQVRYWDENLLQGSPPADPFPQVVGITVHLTFAKRAYALARWFRQRGACVILGGLHVLSCPEEAAPHADALAIGDGVQLWPIILEDITKGRLKRVYRSDFSRPYREDPAPRRDLVPRDSFLTTTSLIATRGCHNRCGFCYLSTEGLHMPYLVRDVEQVAGEFAADNQPYAVFIDNNLGSKPEYLRRLCRALRPLEKIWSAAVTLDVTDDPDLVREMALAGCTGVFIGFESLADRNLKSARKRTPRTADYARRVAILHANGIQVNGSFVLGFDADGPEVFEETASWIEQNRLECATFHILTPYPGTPLFRQFEAEGRLRARDSFYLATVSETGWPYIQHRGGKAGFLRVLGPSQLAFADYAGNRQMLSTGNLAANDRVALFLMDYPQRTRLKILGHAQVLDAREQPELVVRLTEPAERKVVERVFLIDVVSFDWNCPKYITPRYTEAEIAEAVAPLHRRIAELEAQLKLQRHD